jgi:hypothetical protein
LLLSDDDGDGDDSSDSLEEEVSSEVTSMNQLNTSESKLLEKRGHGMVFSDDGDTASPLSEPCTPENRQHPDEEGGDEDDDDDFCM